MAEPLLYKLAQAAHVLNVSIRQIYRLIDAGVLESVKLGKSRRVTSRSVRRVAADGGIIPRA